MSLQHGKAGLLQIKRVLQQAEAFLLQIKGNLLQVESSRRPGKLGVLHISGGERLRPEGERLGALVLQQIFRVLQQGDGRMLQNSGWERVRKLDLQRVRVSRRLERLPRYL